MSDSPIRSSGKLEVEDGEAREARIGSLLQRLNEPTSAASHNPSTLEGSAFDFGDRSTFPIEPPTELLARVQAFLPQLQASNEDLANRARDDPSSVDIENVIPDQERYIQMNLGLGVFEDRSVTNPHRNDGEEGSDGSKSGTSSSSSISSDSTDEDDMEDDSQDGTDSDEMEIITSAVLSRPIRPLPKRTAKPNIVVLPEQNESSGPSSSAPA